MTVKDIPPCVPQLTEAGTAGDERPLRAVPVSLRGRRCKQHRSLLLAANAPRAANVHTCMVGRLTRTEPGVLYQLAASAINVDNYEPLKNS